MQRLPALSLFVAFLMIGATGCSKPDTTNTAAGPSADNSGDIIVPDDETAADDDIGAGNEAQPSPGRDLSGRWIGVEGMYLVVTPGAVPDRYRLEMQWDLDHKGRFDGHRVGDAIMFERDGVRATLRPTNGDATGLKYLAGKTDCLTVKSGEGYCRG